MSGAPSTSGFGFVLCKARCATLTVREPSSTDRGFELDRHLVSYLYPAVPDAVPRAPHSLGCGGSALVFRAQQREGVLDALLEDLIGELSVGQGAGELERPDHHREDAERLRACQLLIVRRQAGGDVVDDGQQALGVRPLDCLRAATDLVEQGGGRAAVVGAVAMLN